MRSASGTSNHERFKDITAGLQSIVTMLAFAIGGCWVLYSFFALGSVQKSRAEIAALEQNAAEQPILQVDIEATSPPSAGGGHRYILVSVKLKNDGKRALEFESPKLKIFHIPGSGGETQNGEQIQNLAAQVINADNEIENMPSRVLRSTQSRAIAFISAVPSSGMYVLQFSAIYSGIKIVDGKFVRSEDVPIDALDQLALRVE